MFGNARPRWTPHIARQYQNLYASALAHRPVDAVADDPLEAFAAKYLNGWPASVEPAQRGELLVHKEAWRAADDWPSTASPAPSSCRTRRCSR
jgi:hypothetical protein